MVTYKKRTLENVQNSLSSDLNRDSWTELFINENMYVSNILYFEIFRIESSRFDNVKEVVITYDESDYDINIGEDFIPKKVGYKIRFIKY